MRRSANQKKPSWLLDAGVAAELELEEEAAAAEERLLQHMMNKQQEETMNLLKSRRSE